MNKTITDTAALQARIAELEAMVAAQAGQEPYCWFHEPTATVSRTMFPPALNCFPLYTRPLDIGSKAIPMTDIGSILNDAMERAVANGANSISMPDEYVSVAHFLSFPQEYAPPAPASLSLVSAALEASAEKLMLIARDYDKAGNPMAFHAVKYCAEFIRAIDPQAIVDEVSK